MVPNRQHAAVAGQSARRLISCAVLVAMIGAATSAADEPPVNVTESGGVYRVSATFSVLETPDVALAVLSDFERIPQYVPDMKTSTVRERNAEDTVVEQEAVAKFAMFSKRIHLVLRVIESAGTIAFRDECGKSFAVYDGSWVVKPAAQGSTITYRLAAKPTFEVPGFVLKRLLKRDASDLIARIKVEMAARGNLRK
jgi:ribosome-associated toxin RatA of RatAB toxin-antitoxin module